MFENQYTVDVKRYIRWYCPPASQRKGFKLWMILLAASSAATALGFILRAGDKFTSIGLLMMFIGFYRGVLFDTMYARRQFYALCRSIDKGVEQQWTRYNIANRDGIESYTDDELCLSMRWEEVDCIREDENHLDIYAAEQLVRFEKDSFTKGTAEEMTKWLRLNHPAIPLESGVPIYLAQ